MFETYYYCDLNNPSRDLLKFVATTHVVFTILVFRTLESRVLIFKERKIMEDWVRMQLD